MVRAFWINARYTRGRVEIGNPGTQRDRVMMLVAVDLVGRPLAADSSDDVQLDLAVHRIAEGLARRLIAADGPGLEVDVDHVRLVVKVAQVHPLQHDVVDAAARVFHKDPHIVEALIGLGFGPLDRLAGCRSWGTITDEKT